MPVYELSGDLAFPPLDHAEPDGLLAVGGDLSPERLLLAYRSGLFPWFNEGDPILWWSPDPRLVLFPDQLRVSRSLGKVLRHGGFEYSMNRDFEGVIRRCATSSRPGQDEGTWISEDMIEAYTALHVLGRAHSVEVWRDQTLVGGLYGIHLGGCFFGESMFTLEANASKCGFVCLVRYLQRLGVTLIDCQVHTDHLERFGAVAISRREFVSALDEVCDLALRVPGEGIVLPFVDK